MEKENKVPPKYTFADFKQGMKVMYEASAGFRGMLSVIFMLVVIAGGLSAIQPLVFGNIVDRIVKDPNSSSIVSILVLFGFLLIGNYFVVNLQTRLTQITDEKMRLSYLHKLYSRMLRLPIAFHKTHRSGEVTEKIDRGVQAIPQFWTNYVFNLAPQFAYLGFSLVIIFLASVKIGLVLLAATVLFVVVSLFFVQPFARLQRQIQVLYNKARGIAGDAVFNVRVIKDSTSEEQESAKMHHAWFEDSMKYWRAFMQKSRNLALFQQTVANTARVIAIWFAYLAFRNGNLSIGLFTAVATYTAEFFNPLQQFFGQWRLIQNNLIAIEDAHKLLQEKTEQYEGVKVDVAGDISFNHVSFNYGESTPVLVDVSLNIKQGEVVAFVGESGVGKSSLIDLVSAYYLPEQGSISIDGVKTSEIDLFSLRSKVAVVSQEITLFNASIMDNIRYGIANATDERVKWAADKAKCDFIERLPNKWDQKVGERGMKLSVGQKQRIAIARAFLRDPKILVLDEPTSALDAASERHIVQSLDEIMKGRTTLIIAHRLSTIRKADTIFVFKEGRVIESGSYAELIAKGGELKRLHDLQSLVE